MNFPSILIEGQIFSGELLQKLDQPDMPGQRPIDFGLPPDVKVKDEIARAWADAQDYWRIFQRKLESQKLASTATTETRQQWIVPLLGLLGYQLEHQQKGAELNGKIYAISHRVTNRAHIPVHIVGYRDAAGLDRKPDNATLRMSPHAMVQEYINLHDQLYGVVTNGSTLRLLRDSFRLVRLNYLEFDLERIFTDGLFADFAILYRLLHASRLPQSLDSNAESILERYHQDSIEQGSRIRDGLRESVQQTIVILGTGFVSNPANSELREQLDSKKITHSDFFGDLLRLIYRLLFLNVVEERNQLFPSKTSAKVIKAYYDYYSVQRLRRLSRTQGVKTDRYHDAWMSLLSTFTIFERPELAAKLGTTAFGGSLFNSQSLGLLATCQLSNTALFSALDCLCSFNDPVTGQRQPVNFGALATEEFGSVYESLLELHPVVEVLPVPRFGFKLAAGNDRKTSGSYYTPSCLVNCLLDSALDPVLEDRIRDYKKLGYETVESAILSVKVCDPACGSGHFLIAAAQRVARRLAVIRSKGDEPSPDQLRHALREVIGRCIYGVDINPMSVELCRVALWLEAVEPGKPLSFLNRHIQCGNSLLGTTPALLKRGIPDEAFEPIEGDDKKVAAAWKKRNREARKGQHDLFADSAAKWSYQHALVAATKDIEAISDESFTDVERKEAAYADYLASSSYRFGKRLHDAWCAAFVWLKKDDPEIPEPVTQQLIDQMKGDPNLCPERVANEIDRLAGQYNFFHWHLAFPDVFQAKEDADIKTPDVTGWTGGFDCILGNPPWERVQFEERAYFADKRMDIYEERNQSRRRQKIEQLAFTEPSVFMAWQQASRQSEGEGRFLRSSGLFPLSAVDKFNLYAIFTELSDQIFNYHGRVGIIVKAGLVTDALCSDLFSTLMKCKKIAKILEFENKKKIFSDVHPQERFALVILCNNIAKTDFCFDNQDIADFAQRDRHISMSFDDVCRLSPNSKNCPKFHSDHEYEIAKFYYKKYRPLKRQNPSENPWGISIDRYINVSDFSSEIKLASDFTKNSRQIAGIDYTPLYEGKLFHQFDHRYATYTNTVSEPTVYEMLDKSPDNEVFFGRFIPLAIALRRNSIIGVRPAFLSVRDISNKTNERGIIASIIPSHITDYTVRVIQLTPSTSAHQLILLGIFNSFALDYQVRQRIGGTHLSNDTLEQLPVPSFDEISEQIKCFVLPRLLELTYTAWDLELFAKDCGYDGPPFIWDEERRFLLRCELDAAIFHLYLGSDEEWRKSGSKELLEAFPTPRDAVSYIMETFPIVKRKDEAAYNNTYRTKETILSIYDAMQTAIRTGQPYQTLLDPPPGPSPAGLPEWKPGEEQPSDWPSHIHPPKGCEGKERQQTNAVTLDGIKLRGRDSLMYAYVHGVEKKEDRVMVTLDAVPAVEVHGLPFGSERLFEQLKKIRTYFVEIDLDREQYDTLWREAQVFLEEGRWVQLTPNHGSRYSAKLVDASSEEKLDDLRILLSSLPEEEMAGIIAKIRLPEGPILSNIKDFLPNKYFGCPTFAAVYDVGQGLCSAICDTAHSSPLMYFDMGCGCYWNAHTRPKKMKFCFNNNPPIILSHWHFDHFMAARYLDQDATNMKWIAPVQRPGPTSVKFAAELLLKGNLLLWPRNINSMSTPWGDIIKCSGCTLNSSGLAFIAKVSSAETAVEPKEYQVLFPGDADYDNIPNINSIQFDALIASHHGGSAWGAPPRPRDKDAPFVLSYGLGNTYHHPSNASVSSLISQGWTRQIDTQPDGNVGLCPSLARLPHLGCGGKDCDLMIRQM